MNKLLGTPPNFLRRKLHYFFPKKKIRSIFRNDIHYFLNYEEIVDRCIIKHGHWEKEQIMYFYNQVNENNCRDIFLDIGAYFGYYSLLSAKSGLFSEIHAIEGQAENYRRLVKHVKANKHLQEIKTYQAAVGDANKDMLFTREHGSSRLLDTPNNKNNLYVKTVTLNSLFDFSGKSIAVKMDIEGHQIPALKGAEKLLAQNKVYLQMEIFPHQISSTIDYMRDNGWRLLHYIGCDFYYLRP